MDNNSSLGEHDPYRDLQRAEREGVRPGFVGGEGGGSAPVSNKSEELVAGGRVGGAAAGLSAAERAAEKPAGDATNATNGGVAGLKRSEASGGGFFSGAGRSLKGAVGKVKKLKIAKATAGVSIVTLLLIVGIAAVGTPVYLVGSLDYGLMQALGFSGTVGILEKQAEYVTAEMAKNGEVPEGYASDLVAAGLDVGQVTMAGDFVRTNKYIANIEDLNEVAVIGSGFYTNGSDGELAFLFEGEVIDADDFVAKVESNPRLYAALSEGADISAKYYYSKDVNQVYTDMGLKRYAFYNWEATGDSQQDQKNYEEIMNSILDGDGQNTLSGGICGEGWCSSANFTGDAKDIINDAGNSKSSAELLNTAMAANQPYKAAALFVAIEEGLQRTRIDGDGPANEAMAFLNRAYGVTYTDLSTGKEVKKVSSILETPNFAAAISDGKLSKSEAANFSLDSILYATSVDDTSVIEKTKVSTNGKKQSSIGVELFAEAVDIDKAESSVQLAFSDKPSDLATTIVGGNWGIEGGSVLNNMINQRVLSAMPSDESVVMEFAYEVDEVLARKAAAERATKSPFDISSPNTFMGSIAHGLASTMIQNHAVSSPLMSGVTTVVDLAGDSVNSLMGDAIADGDNRNYLTTFGDHCQTAGSIGSAADIYCTRQTTIYTGDMSKTKKDWGDIGNSDGYKEFVEKAMTKWMWGVKDCGDGIVAILEDFFGICDDDNATGKNYVMTNNSKDVKKYSGYTLYNTVASLLSGEQSTASRIMEEYYARNPQDDSPAGVIARRSGMTKQEAERALAYADYLAEIANYDASERYEFGAEFEIPERDGDLVGHANKMSGELYCFWRGRVEYDDLRNQNLVA